MQADGLDNQCFEGDVGRRHRDARSKSEHEKNGNRPGGRLAEKKKQYDGRPLAPADRSISYLEKCFRCNILRASRASYAPTKTVSAYEHLAQSGSSLRTGSSR